MMRTVAYAIRVVLEVKRMRKRKKRIIVPVIPAQGVHLI
jgi:hypothetical protein